MNQHRNVTRDDRVTPPIDALFTNLYQALRRLARRDIVRLGERETSASTLVHAAWLDIRQREHLAFDDSACFLAYAGRAMRGILIDRMRARASRRRGGGWTRIPIDELPLLDDLAASETSDLDDALSGLEVMDSDLALVVDLKFFCGFTLIEIAAMQGLSERTVQRRWEKARLLLYRELVERPFRPSPTVVIQEPRWC